MKTVITLKGPVNVTWLRNGSVRIEAKKERPRMHLRGDEVLKLIHSVARAPEPLRAVPVDARCGVL
jgi:hypothetical protein